MPRFDLNGNPIPDDTGATPPAPPAYDPAAVPPIPPGYIPPPPSAGGYAPPPTGYTPPLPGYTPSPMASPPPAYRPAPPPPHLPYEPPPLPGQPPVAGRFPMPNEAPPLGPHAAPNYRPTPPRASAVDQMSSTVKWVAGGAAVFIAFTAVILMAHSPSVPAPSGFKPYMAPNGTYTVDRPNGWKVEQLKNGSDDVAGLTDPTDASAIMFSNKSAHIAIYQGTVQSVTGSVNTPLPASTLLKQNESDLLLSRFPRIDSLQDYSFTTEGFGDGHCLTWLAAPPRLGFGGRTQGYFVALSGGNYYVNVLCECRQDDWNTLKPAFQQVINSLVEQPAPGYQAPVPGGEAYPSGPPPQKTPPIDTTPGL